MPFCEVTSRNRVLVFVLYSSVGMGILLTLVFTVIFTYKWQKYKDGVSRNHMIPKLCVIISFFLFFERVCRVIEIISWFIFTRWITVMCYHIINVISVGGILGTLYTFLILKLVATFERSAQSVPKRERTVLIGLAFVQLFVTYSFLTLNGIPKFDETFEGQIVLYTLAALLLFLSLFLLGKIDIAFARRLQTLVANSSRSNHGKGPKLSNIVEDQVADAGESGHFVTNSASSETAIINKPNINAKPGRISIQAIRLSTVSNFDSSQQKLLKTAAKSMVTALWISVSFALLFISAIMFVFGSCADIATSIGHLTLALSYSMIIVSISLSLGHSKNEYEYFCARCNAWVKKIEAWQTDRKVLEIIQE